MSRLITLLRGINSTNDKKHLLANGNIQELDLKVFKYAYDSTKTFGLHFNNNNLKLGEPKEDMFELLDCLANRSLTGDTARAAVINYAIKNGDLIMLICNKDLLCGVTATTLNNVFGKNFIPSFNIQLAKEEDINKIKFPILAQLKYNGARVVALVERGKVTLKSRGGHSFSFPSLENKLKHIPFDCMLDGELTFGDSKNEDHTKVSGIVNSARQGTPIVNSKLVYNIFDGMELDQFNNQVCARPYDDRLKAIENVVKSLNSIKVYSQHVITGMPGKPAALDIFTPTEVANTSTVNNKKELTELYEFYIANGYEGLILKGPKHIYTFKKNKTWIKMKAADTADLHCVGYKEGKNKYTGLIGSLLCEGYVGDKFVTVYVSGLTDAQREMDVNHYLDRIIEVKYNCVIEDKTTGEHSLFLPRMVQVRKDKS